MRIGITYDLKANIPPSSGLPDDFQEEFDSPVTIEALACVLRDLGHEVILLGNGRELLKKLLSSPPDFVFNIAEGQGISRSREARVPAILEMLNIPHTGSDPLTLAVTLDKSCAKRLAQAAGIAIPKGLIIPPGQSIASLRQLIKASPGSIPLPAILKPAWEGSSKGIRNRCLVDQLEDIPKVVEQLRRDHRQPVLVEEFIEGDELTVGVIGNEKPRIVGIMRVVPAQATKRFVYSLEVKRDYLRQVRYECPPDLPPTVMSRIEQATLQVFQALECRDVARVDFRLRDGVPYFLEVNPLPGLNPESSDLVILAKGFGWTYAQLIESIVRAALERQQKLNVGPSCLADKLSVV
ncbi:MAG: ATP-grasp domain-containing protein [Gemmataceae bacterium]